MNLQRVATTALPPKHYRVGGGRFETASQYLGVKEHGPLADLNTEPVFYFVFREVDRPLARHLYRCLNGEEFSYQFPGMRKMFHVPFGNDNIEHVVVADFSPEEMTRAVAAIKDGGHEQPVPIIIVPGDETSYYVQKASFIHAGLATQDVKVDTLRDARLLKWSVAGIGLQIFCKAGGQPWRVKVPDERTLILGISQVWSESDGDRSKYFAYSVLTDASGVFRDISILGKAERHSDYLREIRQNLAALVRREASGYDAVVIHTTFKIRRKEMSAIEAAVRDVETSDEGKDKHFAVIRVNTNNDFFGYSAANASLVPYESSVVRLGFREYLMWFEGTQYHNPNISKRMPGPTHVKIEYRSEGFERTDAELLTELLNLSGANWRGFNAKSAPVSVFYCRLAGKFIAEFTERGLPMPGIEYFTPWFL